MRNIKMKKAIILLIFMLSSCSSGYQSPNMYYPIKDNQNKQIGSIYSDINISRWRLGGGLSTNLDNVLDTGTNMDIHLGW